MTSTSERLNGNISQKGMNFGVNQMIISLLMSNDKSKYY